MAIGKPTLESLGGLGMKTILLTGGTGFLGSHLAKKLVESNYKVILLKRSNSNVWRINDIIHNLVCYDIDREDLETPFKDHKVDIIIHCATNYGRKGESITQILDTNLNFPLKLLETALSFNTDTFFNTDTILYKYLNYYSLSKKQFVEWLKIVSKDIKVFNLKLEHIYGEKDDLTKFIPWIIVNLLQKKEEILLTKGEQKRDFIYIEDVVDAYLEVLKKVNDIHNGYYEYEIGTGNSVTIRYIVELIKTLTGNTITKLNFGALEYREGEIMESKADISKMIKDFNWKPKYTLEEGLLRTIKWYKEVHND